MNSKQFAFQKHIPAASRKVCPVFSLCFPLPKQGRPSKKSVLSELRMARYKNYTYHDYLQYLSLPTHFSFLLVVVFLILSFTWYINYESKVEDMMDQLKFFLIITPIILLLLVHWLSSDDRRRVPFFISLPEQDSLHRAGGSPWGVAALLIFLVYMISYQSKLQESWFPLLTRR